MALDMIWKQYTWGRGNCRNRLDWCMCDPLWYNRIPSLQLSGLPKYFSDHNSLLLQLEGSKNGGLKPFRTVDAWLSDPRFKPFVKTEWSMIKSAYKEVE